MPPLTLRGPKNNDADFDQVSKKSTSVRSKQTCNNDTILSKSSDLAKSILTMDIAERIASSQI
jgi:hypothetical protein